jgi:ribonuclease Z
MLDRTPPRPWALAAVAAAVLGLLGCQDWLDGMVEGRIRDGLRGERTDWLDDGALHLVLCGTGTPLPAADRAGPCAAVLAGGRFFLVDVGPGSHENLQLWRLPRSQLSGVLLTHFHSDHIGELGEVVFQSWTAGRAQPLDVYGPPGVARVVRGFDTAYALDRGYRVAHHGEQAMPAAAGRAVARTFQVSDRPISIYERDGLRIRAFAVDHDPVAPAVGYRFEYGES